MMTSTRMRAWILFAAGGLLALIALYAAAYIRGRRAGQAKAEVLHAAEAKEDVKEMVERGDSDALRRELLRRAGKR